MPVSGECFRALLRTVIEMPSPTSSQPHALVHVFNRYVQHGGEETIVNKIHEDLSTRHAMTWCRFESAEWQGANAPSRMQQAARLFYNKDARAQFQSALDASGAGAAVFHNIYPVGSPSLYHTAQQRKIPVVQFLHNWRPFSVSGALCANGALVPDGIYGNHTREVMAGTWQGSVLKSAVFALMLKSLRRSGWLESVKAWIVLSDFMRQKLVDAGALPAARVHVLRHSWDAHSQPPQTEDAGYYLFLGRLIGTKGVVALLDAWDILFAQLGPKTPPLHIAGEGPLESMVQARLRTNPYIGFLGQIGGETKREVLRRCRAVVVPSTWWEPLGLVVYEAYDYGKPVLAARTGGLGEIVQHGFTGLQHEPGEVSQIVRDVLEMEATPPAARLAAGRAGRQWLLTETSTQSWLSRFDSILASACE